MRRPVRKIITFALAAALILTAAGAAIAAPADAGMEKALLAVRALVDIDESVYTDFSYSSTMSNQQTREGLIWNFDWSDTKNAFIYAAVTDGGTVLQLRKYDYSESSFGFAKISRAKASDLALGFLKKASPDIWSYYSRKGEPEVSIGYAEYTFNYAAKVNGHEFDASYASISVNKFTGEVTGYGTSNVNPKTFTFEAASKTIGTDAAIAAYADKLGLTLEYRSYYDYAAGKLAVFPVYLMASGSQYISAVTGDIVEYVYDRGEGEDGGAKESPAYESSADTAMGGNARLSPQEVAAVEKAGNFISSDEALTKLLAIMELSDIDLTEFSESYTYLNRDYVNRDRYVYNISMYANDNSRTSGGIYYLNGRVDATTGRVLSFSCYSENLGTGDATLLTEEQATAAVDKFLAANAPEELKKSKLDSVQVPVADRYNGNQVYYFNYYRVENNTPFRDNRINVTLDARTGRITGYSVDWYLSATFPSVASVLTPVKALAGYVGQNGIRTNYVTVGDGKVSLVYDFGPSGYIDPFTGKALDYDGTKREDSAAAPEYSDVKGHWSEKYVTRLLDNGVYQWGGKFEPEREMTQLEFLQYLMTLEPWYQAEPLQYFRDNGIKTDIKADAKTPVTRQEAARIVIEYLGYGKLAEKHKWFAYPFTGEVDEAYKGYVSACCALGIIEETEGDYNAKAGVTRAEAAMMLHNVILAKS